MSAEREDGKRSRLKPGDKQRGLFPYSSSRSARLAATMPPTGHLAGPQRRDSRLPWPGRLNTAAGRLCGRGRHGRTSRPARSDKAHTRRSTTTTLAPTRPGSLVAKPNVSGRARRAGGPLLPCRPRWNRLVAIAFR